MFIEYLKNTSKHWLKIIQKSFFPVPKKFIEWEQTSSELTNSEQSIIWIPARQRLKHKTFELPKNLRGTKRDAALNLKINAWSPFIDSDYAVAWLQHTACVFAWDSKKMNKAITEQGLDPSICEIIPESFIRKPHDNGIRLVETGGGIEAQIWVNGLIKLSRWWNRTPNKEEWELFTRSGGNMITDPPKKIPSISCPLWLDIPWHQNAINSMILVQLRRNKKFLLTALSIALIPFFFLLAEWTTLSIMEKNIQEDISKIKNDSTKIRIERREAILALEKVEGFLSLNEYPYQIEIFSRAHNLLNPYNITMSTWSYNQGELEFSFQSRNDIDPRILITAFEEDGLFSNVSSSTRGNRLIFKMNVEKNISIDL